MEKSKKTKEPKRDESGMTYKERLASMREFNKRPGEMEKLKKIRKANRESLHGVGVITRGPNKGLKRGTLKK